MSRLKEIIKSILLKLRLKKVYSFLKKGYDSYYWRERRKLGLPTKETYYVIRRNDDVGLFSYYNTFVGMSKYAIERGYIPVIDMMSYKNTYLVKNDIGKINVWERFFEQPKKISLSTVKHRKRIISAGKSNVDCPNDSMECMDINSDEHKAWKTFIKEYFILSNEAKNKVEKAYRELFRNNEKVLGVLCRGTDYISLKPSGHPVQPSVSETIEKVREIMEIKKYDKIFLASEDINIWNEFKKEFEDKVFTNRKDFLNYNENERLSKSLPNTTNELVDEGMEYLVTIAILSMCSGLIAGRTSGSVAAVLMADNYEYCYIWDKGRY